MSRIEDLAAEASAGNFNGGSSIWVDHLEGEPREFVILMRDRKKAGQRVVATRIVDILKREWDVDVSETSVRQFLNGRTKETT